jgi:hypothetical protein
MIISCSSTNIITHTKSRSVGWAGHVACKEEKMHTGFLWRNLKKRYHLEHVGTDGRLIFRTLRKAAYGLSIPGSRCRQVAG